MRIVMRFLAAAAALALSAGVAVSEPVALERSAKIRSGPGAKYRVIAILSRGAMVDVDGCTGSWCEISWRDRHGYLAHSALAAARSPAAIAVGPAPGYYYDDYPGFDYPGYPSGSSLGIHAVPRWHRHYGRWSGRHPWRSGTGSAGRQPPIGAGFGARPQAGGLAPPPPVSGASGARATDGIAGSGVTSGVGSPPAVAAPAASPASRGEK